MTALTKDRDTRKKPGQLGEGPVAASALIYGGAIVCMNAGGYLIKGSDAAGLTIAGISTGRFDNSAGTNGALTGVFERDGLHLMNLGTVITQANVGDPVYVVDDQTVDLADNVIHFILAGVIAEMFTTTLAYIDIAPAIELQDVFTQVPTDITDPGNAGAIAVTRSGCCAITTAGAETRTLAVPAKTGIKLSISMDVDGGDCVIAAASAINQTGNNRITLNDAGDTILLESVKKAGVIIWRISANDGCTLATV
ncbi:MAG: hypothetical protein A2283_12450 [Lentisphaerae bacterium RIFOXYA12_FULL_48_11]|nr:MAG: hypothetical protein A2283_12450 [Lentisphaerae bacterium RIFOXYA12_FULL_48_11]